MKDLSVYINFPFCRQKCHFCDWVQRVPKKDLFLKPEDSSRQQYVISLCQEIKIKGAQLRELGYVPRIIYWGGGTATTMTYKEVDSVVEALRVTFDLSRVTEWTIEGSPDTSSYEALLHYKQHGFNRFSTGIQSFNNQRLKHLGRRHNCEESIQVVHTAKQAGFEKISIDLMCGFPGETSQEVEENIAKVGPLGISQLSLYTFRPTDGTMMRRTIDKYDEPLEPGNQVKSYRLGSHLLKSLGYEEYGVGYFGDVAENVVAMFSMECDVAGFGSGASSVLSGRYCSHASGLLHEYIKNPLAYDVEVPIATSTNALFTLLRSGLSLYAGISLEKWHERVGVSLVECLENSEVRTLIDLFTKAGGLVIDRERIYLPQDKAALILIGMINGSIKRAKHASVT